MIGDCLAVIMAGGDSRRMGRDKASLMLGEHTLLQQVADVMRGLFPRVAVSVRQPRADIALPQVCDTYTDCGPLAGLYAGLQYAEDAGLSWIFAVATDMPFVQPQLIEFLAAQRTSETNNQAVVPMHDGHPQPLAAFYSVSALPAIRALLEGTGRRSLRAALEQINVRYVDETALRGADASLRSFFDLDTPQDVATAAHHLLQDKSKKG